MAWWWLLTRRSRRRRLQETSMAFPLGEARRPCNAARWRWLNDHHVIEVAGLRGSAGLAGYCATKGDGRLFAKAVAMEGAAAADGIRVNTVHPRNHRHADLDEVPTSAGSNAPIDPNEVTRAGVPFGRAAVGLDRRRTSQTACCFSLPTRPAT
jgi:NAD(P)-dependent dehydrogenase (short-subunit alcohol dehydrogenase family)